MLIPCHYRDDIDMDRNQQSQQGQSKETVFHLGMNSIYQGHGLRFSAHTRESSKLSFNENVEDSSFNLAKVSSIIANLIYSAYATVSCVSM